MAETTKRKRGRPRSSSNGAGLNLSTKFPGTPIKVDGASYLMPAAEALPLSVHKRIDTWRRRLARLLELETPTDEQLNELDQAGEELLGIILPTLPKEVARALPDSQKLKAAEFFFSRGGPWTRSPQAPSTSSPPGSNASMEGTPPGGPG